MTSVISANLLSYICQIAIVAVGAWLATVVWAIRSPGVLLPYYQGALLLALTLPLLAATVPSVAPVTPAMSNRIFSAIQSTAIAAANGRHTRTLATGVAFAIVVGCGLRLAWLLIGFRRLRHYRRMARELQELPLVLVEAERAVGVSVRWFASDDVRGPATYGVRRPVVLLPASLLAGPETALKLIAHHELLHVLRRDWLSVVAEELVRAALWFHPGIWFLLDRVHLHREQVIDQRVVAATGDRRRYAEALLDCTGRDWPLQPRLASTWLRGRHLRARIISIANGGSMSKRRSVMSAAMLVCSLGVSGWSGLYAFPLHLQAANGNQQQDVPSRARPDGVTQPQVIKQVEPQYTMDAAAARIQGNVWVEAVVETDGTVLDARVVRSLDKTHGLDEEALRAAKAWRFRPGIKDGKPVPVQVTLEFEFSLKDR